MEIDVPAKVDYRLDGGQTGVTHDYAKATTAVSWLSRGEWVIRWEVSTSSQERRR